MLRFALSLHYVGGTLNATLNDLLLVARQICQLRNVVFGCAARMQRTIGEFQPREFGKPDQSSPTKALVFAAKCGVTGVSSCGPGNIPPAMTRRRGNPNWGRPAPEPTPDYAVAKNLNLVVADDAHLVLLEV